MEERDYSVVNIELVKFSANPKTGGCFQSHQSGRATMFMSLEITLQLRSVVVECV